MTQYFHESDLRRIAVAVLYVLSGRASVDFPGTTRAAPSEWVVVSRNVNSPLQENDNTIFPLKVPWDLWQYVVVPLLKGEDQTGGREMVVRFLKGLGVLNPDWETLLKGIVYFLKVGIEPSLMGTVQDQASLDALIGEPVVRGPLVSVTGGLVYPTVDPQLAWIEGHQRFDYPVVD